MADLDEFIELLLKPKGPKKYPLSLHHSEGTKYLQLQQHEVALHHLNAALAINPNCFKTLLKRSRCYLATREYAKAQRDASEALRIHPASTEAANLKGKAEYLMGDFEEGYLTYHRAFKERPGSDELRIGKQFCQVAINSAMKTETGMKVDIHDVVNLKRAKDRQFVPAKRDRIPCTEDFAIDGKFFRELKDNPLAKDFHDHCDAALRFIDESQRFWEMQAPMKKSKQEKHRKHVFKNDGVIKRVRSLKSRCNLFLEKGLIKACILEGKTLLKTVDNDNILQMDHKAEIKADTLHLLSLAYKQDKNDFLAYQSLQEEFEISKKYGLTVGEIRASRGLAMYHQANNNYSKARRYFLHLKEKLRSDQLQKDSKNFDVGEGFVEPAAADLDDKEIAEIAKAESWVRMVENKFENDMNKSALGRAVVGVKIADSLSLKKYSDSGESFSSDLGGTGSFYTAEETDSASTMDID